MSALKGCRVVPAWEQTLIRGLEQGMSELTAMRAAGIGTKHVRDRCERDPVFKDKYDVAKATGERRGRNSGLSLF